VPAARRSAVVDRVTREQAKRTVEITAVIAVVASLCIWLFPLHFGDPPAIRKLVAAVLVGIGAAYLARIVVTNMGEMVAESEEPAIREQAQPEPVLRLAEVDMREAALAGADLGRTELTGALLEGADLNAATLHASRLAGADLRESDLRQADLRLADLRDADLRGAQLDGALLARALYNEGTKWPDEAPPPEAEPAIDVSKPDR
jgi:hypothetical protein